MLCPHCGTDIPPKEVYVSLTTSRKPVIYLQQSQERSEESARITWPGAGGTEALAEEEEPIPADEPSVPLGSGRVVSAHRLPEGLGKTRMQDALRAFSSGRTTQTKYAEIGSCRKVTRRSYQNIFYI